MNTVTISRPTSINYMFILISSENMRSKWISVNSHSRIPHGILQLFTCAEQTPWGVGKGALYHSPRQGIDLSQSIRVIHRGIHRHILVDIGVVDANGEVVTPPTDTEGLDYAVNEGYHVAVPVKVWYTGRTVHCQNQVRQAGWTKQNKQQVIPHVKLNRYSRF